MATRAFDHGVAPVAAAFVRVTAMMLILSPWAPRLASWGRHAWIVAGGGAISMLGFAGFFVALDRAPAAAATVVYYTYPVVVLLLSAIVWRRRLQLWEAVVSTAVVIGVALAVGPISVSGSLLVALAPACAAPIGWGLYLLVLSGPAAAMPTLPKVFAGSCGGAVALLPIVIATSGWPIVPVTSGAITSLTLLTACTFAIPAVLVSWGAARAGERTAATIGSAEFAVAVAAGCVFLGDQLTSWQGAGIALVLGAALIAGLLRTNPLVA
jgi:probable blue pigment (indigoidine) exporter